MATQDVTIEDPHKDYVYAALGEVWNSFSVSFSGDDLICYIGPAKHSWDYSSFGWREIEQGDLIGIMIHLRSRSPRKYVYILDPSYILNNTYPLTQRVCDVAEKREASADTTPEVQTCSLCRYQTHKTYSLLTKKFNKRNYRRDILQPHCQSCIEQMEADIYDGLDDKRSILVGFLA